MNKRFAHFTFALLLFIALPGRARAEKMLVGSKDVPAEMNLIVEGLQKDPAYTYEKLLPILKNIDLYARTMSKEDIFLIGKVEIYKTLLKNYEAAIKDPLDSNSEETLRNALAKTSDNFLKWFIQALLQDCQKILRDTLYKEYTALKSRGVKIERLEHKRLARKAELLQFWIKKIASDQQNFPEALQTTLRPKMFEALKNIENSFYLLAKESLFTPLPPAIKSEDELKFFSAKEVQIPKTPPPEKGKTVDEILAPLTKNPPSELPTPSTENWLEKEAPPFDLQKLPKPSNDADWLEDF